MTTHDGGKGDAPRPLGVTMEEFDKNFDLIFNRDKTQTRDNIEIEANTDGKSVTITKTWEI